MKRKIKYIIVTVLVAYMLTAIGIIRANEERGYKAYGGEYLIPVHIGIISYTIYNRKEVLEMFKFEEEEEKEGGD